MKNKQQAVARSFKECNLSISNRKVKMPMLSTVWIRRVCANRWKSTAERDHNLGRWDVHVRSKTLISYFLFARQHFSPTFQRYIRSTLSPYLPTPCITYPSAVTRFMARDNSHGKRRQTTWQENMRIKSNFLISLRSIFQDPGTPFLTSTSYT